MKSPVKQTGNVGTNRIDTIKARNAASAKVTASLAKTAAAKVIIDAASKAASAKAVAKAAAPKAVNLATPKVDVQTAPTAKPVTSSLVSVSDIATELGMNPKTARAKMRRAQKNPKYAKLIDGLKAESGWSKVERNSDNYTALVELLS